MKNIFLLLAFAFFVFTSCQKEDEFDKIEIETITEEPQEINPEITFKAVDKNGVPISDVNLQIFEEGTQTLELLTDNSGTVTTEIALESLDKRLLLRGEKTIYEDNILRIEPEQIAAGFVEITLTSTEESTPITGANVASLLRTDVVLVRGRVTDAVGNPGGFLVYIYELDAILNNDTTLFQNYVFLDQQGFYEMLVPVDVELALSIFEIDGCATTQFKTINAEDIPLPEGYFAESIGSFSEDTTLPTNTNASQSNGATLELTFTGSVVDCDGIPVENATVRFYSVDFITPRLIGSVTTDANGYYNTILDAGCLGLPTIVATISAPNTPQVSYSVDYVEGETTVDFGDRVICGASTFSISDHYSTANRISNNHLLLESYVAGTSLIITENLNAAEQFLLVAETNTDGNWVCTSFEFYQDGELLYRNSEDFLFLLADDGDKIRLNIIGILVEILSGPDAGSDGALFQGSATIYK